MPLSIRRNRPLITLFALPALALALTFLAARSATPSQAVEGQYLHFTGPMSGYIEVPHTPAISPTTEITIEAWVFLDSYESIPASESCQSFVGKDYTISWWLGECAGKLRFFVSENDLLDSAGDIPLHAWAHVAATYDGTTTKLYINGALDTSSAFFSGPLSGSATAMRIGSDTEYDLSPDNAIDEVHLWNVARSAGEVAADMATISTPQIGLVGAWNMEGSPNADVGGFTGTLIGDAEFAGTPITAPPTLPPPFAKGDIDCSRSITTLDAVPVLKRLAGTGNSIQPCDNGLALVSVQGGNQWFNASPGTGYIEIPDAAALNPTDAITIEASVNLYSYLSPGSLNGCVSLVGKGYTTAYWFGICNGQMRFYPRGSGSSSSSSTTLPARQWVRVGVVADQTSVKFYVDGQLTDTFPYNSAPLTTNSQPVRIGSDVNWDFQPWAAIDEVLIWNVARSQAEIQGTMLPIVLPQTGLVAAYHLDGNAEDATGSYNGAAVDTVDLGTHLPLPYWPDLNCNGNIDPPDLLYLVAYVAGVGAAYPLGNCEAMGTLIPSPAPTASPTSSATPTATPSP